MEIKKTFCGNKNSKKCIIVLHGWGGFSWYFKIVLSPFFFFFFFVFYDYTADILNPDPYKVLENFRLFKKEIGDLIYKLKKSGKEEFVIFGTSLGAFLACYFSNFFPEIKKLILNLIGSKLSETVWLGVSTKKIKQKMEESNWTFEKLRRLWQEIEPENNIPQRKNIEYLIFISKKEKTIPFRLCEEFVGQLKGKKIKVYYNKYFGHGVASYLNPLRLKKIKNFLNY